MLPSKGEVVVGGEMEVGFPVSTQMGCGEEFTGPECTKQGVVFQALHFLGGTVPKLGRGAWGGGM